MTETAEKKLDPQMILEKLLTELGEPWLPIHHQALKAVKENDADTLRILSATNLDDSFCRACGYMASIPKLPPTIAILIAEMRVLELLPMLNERELLKSLIQ